MIITQFSVYQYKYLLDSQNNRKPKNTNLVFEYGTTLYIVDSADATKVYKSTNKGLTWSQVDVDPDNSSGDAKSRDHPILAGWYDRDNDILYFVDCENPGDDFDVWSLDLSDDTVTDIGTSSGQDAGSVTALDIFILGGTLTVMCLERRTSTYMSAYDVSSAPFSLSDDYGTTITAGTPFYGFTCLDAGSSPKYMGVLAWDDSGTYYCMPYYFLPSAGSYAIGVGNINDGYTWTGDDNQRGIWYHQEAEIAFLIVKKVSDGKSYLVRFSPNGF